MLLQAKKKLKATLSSEDIVRKPGNKRSSKSRMKEMREWNDEHAKKIKEVFRSTMATTVVGVLNAYRKPDCKEARITNTEDFKHLARKVWNIFNTGINCGSCATFVEMLNLFLPIGNMKKEGIYI